MSEYRLVWFQHLHKVAGTSLVEQAIASGEKPYPRQINGNPMKEDGSRLELWNLDREGLKEFIDNCEKEGITFIATEWGSPDFEYLASDPRVLMFTCIREPLARFMSNFSYDLYKGFTKKRNLNDYINSSDVSMFEYYTMVFSRNYIHKGMEKIEFNREHYEEAKKNLSLFDHIVVLENREHMKALMETMGWTMKPSKDEPEKVPISVRFISTILGWKNDPNKKKTTGKNPYLAVEMLKRGRIFLFFKYLRHPKIMPDEEFRIKFVVHNKYDIELYQDSKKLTKFGD
jgi:hypothetical protein